LTLLVTTAHVVAEPWGLLPLARNSLYGQAAHAPAPVEKKSVAHPHAVSLPDAAVTEPVAVLAGHAWHAFDTTRWSPLQSSQVVVDWELSPATLYVPAPQLVQPLPVPYWFSAHTGCVGCWVGALVVGAPVLAEVTSTRLKDEQ
jgi:hypothetical protein